MPVIERFKACYATFDSRSLSQLSSVYANDAVFIDPIHKVVGLNQISAYFTDMCTNLVSCRFIYLDQARQNDCVFIQWQMAYQHKTLAGGREVVVPGVTRLKVADDLIVEHEDFYDMGAMVYEKIPLFGRVISWLRKRLATAGHDLNSQPLSASK
ncbi:nuclear transport factor 2 family protein [Simiduia curdlanivorans]|uniref:Nuclear transport factor 2 family protein n=1 Tax=Simiduia curdlanivorans TaxID=1492769 RepID=A0ABV8V462_9GAMM|nr:nuclear transport factor 2 family protein [Simiduia curdlanivorans]MDN3640975.1 nuclear transport factor 2 family protein [Simiduia curdlanivorans]